MYVQDLKLKYGFLSNYNQTIFFRQVDKNRDWELEVSPVIRNFDRYDTAVGEVTLRQAFFPYC
jgi:hypothetical protein